MLGEQENNNSLTSPPALGDLGGLDESNRRQRGFI